MVFLVLAIIQWKAVCSKDNEMCIYYGNQNGLTYSTKEHIFPAGLGGNKMLPIGYVSDQANALFSPMESVLMHDSLIALDRSLFGPGKRGSLSPQKASSSNVVISKEDTGKLVFSYTSQGTPYIIPQYYRGDNKLVFSANPNDGIDGFNQFIEKLRQFNGKYKLIISNDVPENHILVACFKGKYYIGTSNSQIEVKYIEKEIKFAISQFKIGDIKHGMPHVKQDHAFTENSDIARVYAKTALNVLANFQGEAFVKQPLFNDIRNWIIRIPDCKDFFHRPKTDTKTYFPEKSHWCVIQVIDNYLVGVVGFYNSHVRTFNLCEYSHCDFVYPIGMVCDWQNNKEYTLMEWIVSMTNKPAIGTS